MVMEPIKTMDDLSACYRFVCVLTERAADTQQPRSPSATPVGCARRTAEQLAGLTTSGMRHLARTRRNTY